MTNDNTELLMRLIRRVEELEDMMYHASKLIEAGSKIHSEHGLRIRVVENHLQQRERA